MGTTKPGVGRWPGPVIAFEIDGNFDNPNRITDAIKNHWEERTNVRFVRRVGQSDFLLFRHGQECSSHVGHNGGKHPVNLKPNCDVPGIVHEIGHAAGLIHEHQRSDRNSFVMVQTANIEAGKEDNFNRVTNSVNLTDYDLRSIMHYRSNAFSKNNQDTLTGVDPNAVLDTSSTFTTEDVQSINELYPHVGIVRRSDSGVRAAGRVSEIGVAHAQSASTFVTAVRTAEGELKLILWGINTSGGISRVADSGNLAGKASSIALDRGQLFVSACRTASGDLKLISWSIANNKFTRRGDSGNKAGRASLIRTLALTDTLILTACRASNGDLKLISWQLSNGSFERLKDSGGQAGAVSEISMVRVRQVGSSHHVATTVRAGDGRAKTIIWNVTDNGQISRLSDSGTQMGEATMIETAIHPSTGLLTVSCKTAENTLKLITLAVSANGGAVRRRHDTGSQAGRIRSNALMARPTGVLSAVGSADGSLLLIGWSIDADGRIFRLGDSGAAQAGHVGLVRLGKDTGRGDAPIITCVQTDAGNLKIISWDDQPDHGELA